MATRVNGTTETISSKYKVTPYYYYTVSETATTYSLTLYGGIAINNVYFEDWQLALQITGTGKTTQSKRLLVAETGPKDVQFISAFTWSWNKTKATQSITINAIHGTWNDEGVISPKPAYAAKKTFTIPTKTTYLIKYDANGGTGAPAQQTKWHGENITLQAGIPTRANYTFMGWATSASGSVAYQPSATYTANADVTLYAVWKPFEYAVTYNANGGTGAPAQQTKYYGADLTLSAVIPIRAGYTFLGWATSQGGAVAYQPSATYTANSPITLYAVWEAYYTYTINTMRVNASGDIIEDPNGEWIYIKANLTTEDYTNNPLTAYHFTDNGAAATVGWYKNSDKTNTVSFPYQPTANSFILYAWYHADTEKHELSFQFDTNHTTGKVISVIVPPIFRTMDFLRGGKGVAIGKRATQEGFDVEMNTVFRNEIKCSETNGNIKNIYDVFYPVGSYYETNLPSAIPSGQSTPTDADLDNLGVTWFDPNFAWGGTWALESGGRVHISAGKMANNSTNYWGSDNTDLSGNVCNFPIGESGGETKHTLDATQMPPHYHNTQAAFSIRAMSYNGGQPVWGGNGTTVSKITGSTPDTITQSSNQFTPYNIQLNKNSDSKGGGEAHNNMQPYIVVNRWHRTA